MTRVGTTEPGINHRVGPGPVVGWTKIFRLGAFGADLRKRPTRDQWDQNHNHAGPQPEGENYQGVGVKPDDLAGSFWVRATQKGRGPPPQVRPFGFAPGSALDLSLVLPLNLRLIHPQTKYESGSVPVSATVPAPGFTPGSAPGTVAGPTP